MKILLDFWRPYLSKFNVFITIILPDAKSTKVSFLLRWINHLVSNLQVFVTLGFFEYVENDILCEVLLTLIV